MTKMTVDEAIKSAEQRLLTAKHGLADIRKTPGRLHSGLANVIVFGRAVTFALQRLRNIVDGFDEWYAPHKAEMQADPVMSYFFSLRNPIEKEGKPVPVATSSHITSLRYPDDFGDPPPNAVGVFIVDQEGASGWLVKTPEGGEEKYYAALPPDAVRSFSSMEGAPSTSDGQVASAVDLAQIYVNGLDLIVKDARKRFIPLSPYEARTLRRKIP